MLSALFLTGASQLALAGQTLSKSEVKRANKMQTKVDQMNKEDLEKFRDDLKKFLDEEKNLREGFKKLMEVELVNYLVKRLNRETERVNKFGVYITKAIKDGYDAEMKSIEGIYGSRPVVRDEIDRASMRRSPAVALGLGLPLALGGGFGIAFGARKLARRHGVGENIDDWLRGEISRLQKGKSIKLTLFYLRDQYPKLKDAISNLKKARRRVLGG